MGLPVEGYVRVHHIVGCRKRGLDPVIPVSKATWWAGVKSGRYPKGILLSPGIRVWRVEDIRALLHKERAA